MTSVSQLQDQIRSVLMGMADSKNEITDLEDKVSRLKKASRNLETSISEVETIERSISKLTVDRGSWKGKEEDDFEEDYSSYTESVENYVSGTKDAKDAIDDDIKNYEADIDSYTTGLNNLEDSLDSLEKQIEQAQKE